MIDPLLSLAFNIQSSKGVYALMLGSGVSRSSGIPTGWEVVLDLIRKLAALEDQSLSESPEVWYRDQHGENPQYDTLLDAIAGLPAERLQLLKDYFEPTDEERSQGIKLPSPAHRAIAKLVSKGYIRIIITTNFDRLMEQALAAEGVIPVVISTPDAVEGALPLAHQTCVVVKLHGDYLDVRIKNTTGELAQYDERINTLLDRIFDEFGLVICGWSGEWDQALRSALERCKGHRFSTYWCIKDEPGVRAKDLIQLRQAILLKIMGGDQFFSALADKVDALDQLASPHPLSVRTAVATVKKYLVDDRHRIALHDLIVSETERVYEELSDKTFPVDAKQRGVETTRARLQRYEAKIEILLSMMTAGCYWGDSSQDELWIKSLQRIANPSGDYHGVESLLNMRYYPAFMLLYGGGLAALARKRYDLIAALLTKVTVYLIGEGSKPFVHQLCLEDMMNKRTGFCIEEMERCSNPINEYIWGYLRDQFRDYLPSDQDYTYLFDKYECLLSVIYGDAHKKHLDRAYYPSGCFVWRGSTRGQESNIYSELTQEIEDIGNEWPFFQLGYFEGSMENFKLAMQEMRKNVRRY